MVYAIELSNKTQGKRKIRRKKLWFLIPPLNVSQYSIKTLISSFPSQPGDMCPEAMSFENQHLSSLPDIPLCPQCPRPSQRLSPKLLSLKRSASSPGAITPRAPAVPGRGARTAPEWGCSGGARPLRPPAVQNRPHSVPRVQPPLSSPRVAGTRRDPSPVPGVAPRHPSRGAACPRTSGCGPSSPPRPAAAGTGRRRHGEGREGPLPGAGSGAGWEGNAAPAGASRAPSRGTCNTSVRGYRILPRSLRIPTREGSCALTGVWRYPRWHPPSPPVRRRRELVRGTMRDHARTCVSAVPP